MKFPIGLQTYTIREELSRDYWGTLERVARIGYQGLELGLPPAGTSPAELKAFLEREGLDFVSSHVWLGQLDYDWEPQIDYVQQMGGQYLAVSHRWDGRPGVLAAAEVFNRVGERCRENGIQLVYHNHNWEFDRYDGERGLDILLDATDRELVKLELDTYWVQRGGADPVQYLRRLEGRCPVLHIKDMEPGAEQFFAEVGAGILPWPEIWDAAADAGVGWLLVEQDQSRRPIWDSVALSYRNLQAMGVVAER